MFKTFRKWPAFLLIAVFCFGATAIQAGEDDDDECEDEVELDAAAVFIEWNSTDGDYGIQVFWDGEPWTKMKVENAKGKTALKVKTRKNLKAQGLTEGFFESAEPPATELSLEDFLKRHAEGTYEFEGRTQDGDELVGEAEFTHTLPSPATNLSPAGGATVSHEGFTVSFDEVTEDTEGNEIDIVYYEVVVEKDDDEPYLATFTVILGPDTTSVEVPGAFLEPETEYKLEVIAVEDSGNKTITETGLFETDAAD
ncbi:MAG: fibronectin type III domain-containing protein [Planctomycetota bacterium]|nr:fibronectin type III domain-containing protein [Planctomycetota bacterium]